MNRFQPYFTVAFTLVVLRLCLWEHNPQAWVLDFNSKSVTEALIGQTVRFYRALYFYTTTLEADLS